MPEGRLLVSQRNTVLESIREARLDPRAFIWEAERSDHLPGRLVSMLRFIGPPTRFYFKFDQSDDYLPSTSLRPGTIRVSKFSPGSQSWTEEIEARNWPEQLTHVSVWLANLKREAHTPDLWEQLKQYSPSEIVIDTRRVENTPFSNHEVDMVINALDELASKVVKEFELQEGQIAFVAKQIEYLKQGVKKHGRIDWLNISIGVLVNIAINLALEPEKTKTLWELVRSCFVSVLSLPVP